MRQPGAGAAEVLQRPSSALLAPLLAIVLAACDPDDGPAPLAEPLDIGEVEGEPSEGHTLDPCEFAISYYGEFSSPIDPHAAAEAPAWRPGAAELSVLGREVSEDLAAELIPEPVCEAEVSAGAAAVFAEVETLAAEGEIETARQLLESFVRDALAWARPQVMPASIRATPVITETIRTEVRDLMGAAAWLADLGGDPQPLFDAASERYRSWAEEAAPQPGWQDLVHMAEDLAQLGQEALARELLRRAAEQYTVLLDEKIDAFEPCEASEDDVTELLDTLAQAMLLGVEGTQADGHRNAAVSEAANTAAQRLAGMPTECDEDASFEVEVAAADGTNRVFGYSCGGIDGQWQVTAALVLPEGTLEGTGSFVLPLEDELLATEADLSYTQSGTLVFDGEEAHLSFDNHMILTLVGLPDEPAFEVSDVTITATATFAGQTVVQSYTPENPPPVPISMEPVPQCEGAD